MIAPTLAALALQPDAAVFAARARDWRNGAVVYQVFIDRFAPPKDLASKEALIQAPRSLKKWAELPRAGKFLDEKGLWSHELEFWGGDFASFESQFDYLQKLGPDVIYFQPLHQAYTNHKYDAQDYTKISPEIGTREDLRRVIRTIQGAGMKVMLDGVFNHMGRTSDWFHEAFMNPQSSRRDWYFFDPNQPNGYRGWVGVGNLPALNLENKKVRDYLWNSRNSVVRQYLRDGIDGWRLDVAFELGPHFLTELTKAAHQEKPGSAVVGEISGYPADWAGVVDGVFNFHLNNMAHSLLKGQVTGAQLGRALEHLVQDAGMDMLLKSWVLTDNHDTSRFATTVPDPQERAFLRTLQFTFPGCPVIYYGSELGMTGEGDPANRAPMRWDLATSSNPELAQTKKLLKLRRDHPALKIGDMKVLATEKLLGFARVTEKVSEAVIVVANPTSAPVKETFPSRVGRIMSWGEIRDVFSGATVRSITGMVTVEVPPKTVMVFTPVLEDARGNRFYDRFDP